MNNEMGDQKLKEARLEKMFEAFWPNIDNKLKAINQSALPDKKSKKESQDIMLEEMLELLRAQQLLLREPEKLLPREY